MMKVVQGAASDYRLKLDLDLRTSLPSAVTFTRSSLGTSHDSSGVLQTASTDITRFDYNPDTDYPSEIKYSLQDSQYLH